MSMPTLRAGFIGAAKGALRLDTAALHYVDGQQQLRLTGWHNTGPAFGVPFAIVSKPFNGDPVMRAAQLAADLVRLHSGEPMPAPIQIKGLADTLRSQLTLAKERASKIGESAKAEVANLHTVLDDAEGVVQEVKVAAMDIQSALGLSSNGGGELDDKA